MEDKDSEVKITKPDGTEASDEETRELLQQLQKGVLFLPQNR